jgi:D-glycero-D-manno-heptose 1,7-bisphosphate phosphatase
MEIVRAVEGVRLVIFDADDTLRRTLIPGQPCPCAPDEWELLPGVRERLALVDWRRSDLLVGIASNQDWVGYGRVTQSMSERLLRDAIVSATSGQIREPLVRLCPHVPEAQCRCRKPEPGMLLDLMRDAGATPNETLYVGNAEVDAEAARRAGVRFRWAAEVFR